jgi:hypothetical protein
MEFVFSDELAITFVSAEKFVSEILEFVGVRFAVMPEPFEAVEFIFRAGRDAGNNLEQA